MSEAKNLFPLCATDAIAPGEIGSAVLPDGIKVAIYNVAGEFYVTDDLCTHGQSSLSEEGVLEGPIVECGWHFGRFDVTTGQPKGNPCTVPLRVYPVIMRDNRVFIAITNETK